MATKKKKPKAKPAKVGRPTKYREEYCQAIIDYFNIPAINELGNANTPPYFMNFCVSIGINTDTMYEWISKHVEFSEAYKIAQTYQRQLMIDNSLTGGYNASFAWRAMQNVHGWRDQQNLQVGLDEATLNTILNTLPPDQAEKTKAALMAIAKKK